MRAVNQLMTQDALGWVFVDNSRLAEQHGDIPLDRYYPTINRVIIDPIDALNNLNRRDDIVPIRSLDGQDVLRLLMSRGVMSFLTFAAPELTSEGIVKAVRDGLLHHSVQPQGLQLEYVSYIGLVIEAPEAILANTSFATFEHVHETLKRQTGGAAVHLGVYRGGSQSSAATVRVFASAQSLPDGFRTMLGQAQREGKQLQAKLQRELGHLELGEIDDLELLRAGPRIVRHARALADNAARAVDTPKRSPNVQTPPTQQLNGGLLQRTPARNGPPLRAAVAASAGKTKIPPMLGSFVNRNTYELLVSEYRATDSQEVRDRVLTQLRRDHGSDNARARLFAAWALSELRNTPELHLDANGCAIHPHQR